MAHIKENVHPEYARLAEFWRDWRLTYEGGEDFVDEFLVKFSTREDATQFQARKKIAYLPAFAKEGVNDVRNAIFQRTADVTREGGSANYQTAVKGEEGGVDLRGSTMGGFMGRKVLPELLVLGKVGIFIDMPALNGETLADNQGKRPYMYHYTAENILNWHMTRRNNGSTVEFDSLLLRDWRFTLDEKTGLAGERVAEFRLLRLIDDKVTVQFFQDADLKNSNGETIVKAGDEIEERGQVLDISRIPFVLLELSDSLMTDITRYQASLMNLASSDMFQLIHANFPFLTEQVDARAGSPWVKGTRGPTNDGTDNFDQRADDIDKDVEVDIERRTGLARDETVNGPTQGRTFGKGLERPAFINPSSETVKASMDKQQIMKEEVRELLSLSLSNIQPRMASAEAKQLDERGLESGLSGIALEMEQGERMSATFFAMFEGNSQVATVKYPERYALTSGADRREEIGELRKTLIDCPSEKGRKEILKKIVELSIGNRLSDSDLEAILKQIDSADFMSGDPKLLELALDNQLVSGDVAARALGLPGGEDLKIAAGEHAERAARVAKAQASVKDEPRGTGDLQSDPTAQDKGDKGNE